MNDPEQGPTLLHSEDMIELGLVWLGGVGAECGVRLIFEICVENEKVTICVA